MFLIQDIVYSVVGASQLQLLQGHSDKFAPTSVSKGSVIQCRRVILELFVIPLPGRDPDLGLDPGRGGSSPDLGFVGPGSMLLDSARRLAASLLLAVA